MVSYFLTALPLLFLLLLGVRFKRISSLLILFADLSFLSSLLLGESTLALVISAAVVIVLATINFTRNNLYKLNAVLILILSISAGLFSFASLPAALILILIRRPSLATAISSAAALSYYISILYYLELPLAILPFAILVLLALMMHLNEQRALSKP